MKANIKKTDIQLLIRLLEDKISKLELLLESFSILEQTDSVQRACSNTRHEIKELMALLTMLHAPVHSFDVILEG